MNAAIIGATGLIGHYLLLNLLADARYQTVLAIGRRAPELAAETAGIEKLIFVETQLQQLTELNLPVSIDHSFCCLGTTIKQAGSQENFIKVDHTAVIDFAKLAIEYQSQTGVKLFVVTALDANENSTVFYNRVKGQVQKELSLLPLSKLYIFQPSLLLGERASQRTLEDIGQKFFAIASGIFIGPLAKYKPITGKLVADNMLAVAIQDYELVTDADLDNDSKLDNVMVRIIDNKQMHRLVN
ncbi:nucleoside-diphosphate sugar epimerase [Shewanella electrodiphila]|uniref:Nucleoside-diphosphate sugar epimerase n=1 Tax=Shewanella electrodiphila TaxID=934143 RepID=A0ABT0KNY4_9GAMM|nr:nucleoside-diphosphate sugar epimerase [Shewanella electrodiphila]MCL1045547.1 nucleoside-diphosphate sugar epimerase [Shewanella electrodiphila]